jgi:peptide/nickel transport system permease protein
MMATVSHSRLARGVLAIPPAAFFGLAIFLIVALVSLFASYLSPLDPAKSSVFFLSPPNAENWLGTDDLGRDIYTRVLYGGRSSLLVGIGAAVIATLIGVPVGIAAGYLGGRVDLVAVQFINMFIALPGLVLALKITAMIGATMLNLMIVLGVVIWPRVARLVRGQAFEIREALFVEAARAAGGSAAWIIRRHILPNAMRIIAAQFALSVAYAIFTSASLSFLGLGVPPPTPDWGAMVRSGLDYLAINPMMSLAPSCAVALTVLGFYSLGSSIK